MGLFQAIVKTTINTVTLPVAIVKDVVTCGMKKIVDDEDLYTTEHLKKIKDEASTD